LNLVDVDHDLDNGLRGNYSGYEDNDNNNNSTNKKKNSNKGQDTHMSFTNN